LSNFSPTSYLFFVGSSDISILVNVFSAGVSPGLSSGSSPGISPGSSSSVSTFSIVIDIAAFCGNKSVSSSAIFISVKDIVSLFTIFSFIFNFITNAVWFSFIPALRCNIIFPFAAL